MDIKILTGFFMWCSILNMGLLMFSFLFLAMAGDFAYRIHGKWFPIPREKFNAALYTFLGMYKILIFVFNMMPYLALVIIS